MGPHLKPEQEQAQRVSDYSAGVEQGVSESRAGVNQNFCVR